VAGLAATFGSGAMTNSIPEFETDTNCFLIIGSNTSEGHPLIATRILKAKQRGAKIIVFDPRRNQIACWADLSLPFPPGTDVAVFNGMIHVIIQEGLADEAFISERTEGYEELKKLVADYPPEKVEEISHVPAESLRLAARMYAAGKPAAIIYAMGITQHTTGVDNVKSTANLAMLCGNLGVPAAVSIPCGDRTTSRAPATWAASERVPRVSGGHFGRRPEEVPGGLGKHGPAPSA
jgi:anaerobic selenocysteine-containing dehydrogenase